jgi:2-polyprenyl-3-methyl-5-hydroxy-6-metoxy-1,4-benzoquinol methylase
MSPPCILCGEERTEKLFEKGGKDFVRCRECGLVRLDPLPSVADIAAYYDQAYDGGSSTSFVEAEEIRRLIAEHRLARVRAVARPGRWLDVGCSTGQFVEAAVREGITAQGIDVSPGAVRLARERGLQAEVARVEDFAPDGRFDAITAFDVIEHSRDPGAFVDRLREWLAPRGKLVLTLPDVSSIYPRLLMRKHWFYYAPNDHLFYFDPTTIRALLEAHGFQVKSVDRAYKPLTAAYVVAQLEHFNPALGAPARLASRLVGESLLQRPLPLYVGEMHVVAERASSL